MLPISALVYIFSGSTALWYALRSFKAYKKTGNEYSLSIFQVGIGVSLAFYFYGFPILIFDDGSPFLGFMWALAQFPLFIGLGYVNGLALKIWGYKTLQKFLPYLIFLLTLTLFFTHIALDPPYPYLDGFGLMHWDVNYPYNAIFSLMIGVLILIPAAFFMSSKVYGRKALLKKIFFCTTFILAGAGGVIKVIYDNSFYSLFGAYLLIFVGFLMLGLISLVDAFIRDDGLSPGI